MAYLPHNINKHGEAQKTNHGNIPNLLPRHKRERYIIPLTKISRGFQSRKPGAELPSVSPTQDRKKSTYARTSPHVIGVEDLLRDRNS